MIFPDIESACKAVAFLKAAPVSAVELIDRADCVLSKRKREFRFLKLLERDVCALLVETVAGNKIEIDRNIEIIKDSLKSVPAVKDIQFTDIPAEYELLWKIRKGCSLQSEL